MEYKEEDSLVAGLHMADDAAFIDAMVREQLGGAGAEGLAEAAMHDARVQELLEEHKRRVAQAGAAAASTSAAAAVTPRRKAPGAAAASASKARPASAPRERPTPASSGRKSMAQRLAEEDAQQCTFRPKINKDYPRKSTTSRSTEEAPRTREERLKKLAEGRAAYLKKAEERRAEQERREKEECTFRPKINKPRAAKPAPGKKSTARRSAANANVPVEERLLRDHEHTKALREAARAALENREREECTFQPKTNSSSNWRKAWAASAVTSTLKTPRTSSSPIGRADTSPEMRPIHQRLGDIQRRQKEKLMQARLEMEEKEKEKFSFRPSINENSARIAKTSRPAEPLHRRHTSASVGGAGQGVAHEECTFSPEIDANSERILEASGRGLSFDERQEQLRRQSVVKRMQGAAAYKDPQCTFHPDTGNAALVLCTSRHAARVAETVEERMERLANADKKYLDDVRKSISDKYHSQFTYKPEVHDYTGGGHRPLGTYMSGVEELHADTVRRRRAQQAQARAEAELRRTCTFKPKISRKSTEMVERAGGGARTVDYRNPDSVLETIGLQKKEREEALAAKRLEREKAEEAECVFTPTVHAAPSRQESMDAVAASMPGAPLTQPMTVVRGLQRHLDLRIKAKEQAEEQEARERRAFQLDAARRPAHLGATKVEAFSLSAGAAASERAQKRRQELEALAQAREAEECTFRPKTLEGRNRALIQRMLSHGDVSSDDLLLHTVNGTRSLRSASGLV